MLRSALLLALLTMCLISLQCTASEAQTGDVDRSLSVPSDPSGVKPPVNLPTATGSITSSVGSAQHSELDAEVNTATTTTTQAVTENTEDFTAQGSTSHVKANDASTGPSQTTTNTQSSPSLISPNDPQQSQDHRPAAATIILEKETEGQTEGGEQLTVQQQNPPKTQPAPTDGRDSQVQAPITPTTTKIVDAQDTTLKTTSGKGTQGRETSPSPSTATTSTLSRENQAHTVAAGLIQTDSGTKTTTDVTQSAPQQTGQNLQTPTPGTPTVSALAPKYNPTAGQNLPERETTTQTNATDTSGKVTTLEKVSTTTTKATADADHPAKPKTATSLNTATATGDNPATNNPKDKKTIQAPTLNYTTSTAAPSAPAQTSVTSTAEPAKKESTPLANTSQQLSKALQSLDNKDSSIGGSLVCALALLVTLVFVAVAPEF